MPLWRVVPSSGTLRGTGETLNGSLMVTADGSSSDVTKIITITNGQIDKPGFSWRTPWMC
jgi:hypothetical protein